jgi:hypothetical protein
MHKKEHTSKGSPFLDAVCVAALTSLLHSIGHEEGCRKRQARCSRGIFQWGLYARMRF